MGFYILTFLAGVFIGGLIVTAWTISFLKPIVEFELEREERQAELARHLSSSYQSEL
jgi:hypothetical protein